MKSKVSSKALWTLLSVGALVLGPTSGRAVAQQVTGTVHVSRDSLTQVINRLEETAASDA